MVGLGAGFEGGVYVGMFRWEMHGGWRVLEGVSDLSGVVKGLEALNWGGGESFPGECVSRVRLSRFWSGGGVMECQCEQVYN